ncbi:hypothetical protein VTK73DRAFT_7308 [Phialemonium thermophilum]|uniref:Dihydrofolate reductase n=1 Tax=Phialemonium thermophilum TaxID=223376 RepID=A0ABR3WF51_9PEZI
MTTQYYTASSIDGFIATEDDSLDWLFPLADLDKTSYPTFISEVGAIAMGSLTYEWLLRHAVKLGAADEGTWPYSQPVWIFSSRKLAAPAGADIRFVQGDVRPIHAQMQQVADSKNIWIMGGGDLAGQFFDAGLLDHPDRFGFLGSRQARFPTSGLKPHPSACFCEAGQRGYG